MVKLTRKPVVGSGFGPQASRDDIEVMPPAADEEPVEAVVEPAGAEPEPAAPVQLPPQDVITEVEPPAGAEEPEAVAEPAEIEPEAALGTTAPDVPAEPARDATELVAQRLLPDSGDTAGTAETYPEPAEGTTQAQEEEAPDAETSTPTGDSRPGRRTGSKRGVGWARREVARSTLSARQRVRGAWSAAPVRFSAAVQALLTTCLVDEQERTDDYRLSLNHLVSAALRQIPTEPREAALWAQRYQDYLGTRSPATVGTKMSLETAVAEAMPRLQAQLRRDYRYGLIGHVQTWAIIELLADIDAADAGESDVKAARPRVLDRLSRAMEGS